MRRWYIGMFLLFVPVLLKAQIISTVAGIGANGFSGDYGPATAAKIGLTFCITVDKYGNYYFGEFSACRIRKIDTSGVITSVVNEMGISGYGGDGGPSTAAKLKNPEGLCCDTTGNLYIADHQNFRIRKVDISTGIITTYAGTGAGGDSGDGGPATAADIFPDAIQFDKFGNLYVTTGTYNKIRKINPSGVITTIAGIGTMGSTGDSGPATAAELYNPVNCTIDDTGNVYFPEVGRIRKISVAGIITTFAGNGVGIYNGDGMSATSTQMEPLVLSYQNNMLYFSDSNQRVRIVDTVGIVHTLAGTGVSGYGGDGGPATAAQLNEAGGITLDVCGNVYFVDEFNYRIRKITNSPILTIPTITLSGITSFAVGTLVTLTATVTNAGSSCNIEWYNHGIELTTTTVPSVTYTKMAGIDTITARVVSTATYGCYDSTTSSGFIVTAETTGINTLSNSKINIYPNPANDVLHIDVVTSSPWGRQGGAITISNLLGQTMYTYQYNSEKAEINIGALPTGVYIVKITDDGGEKTITKIIKQ